MDLSCENINKAFGSVVALKNANISVVSGEVRALLGGNGSGKSTLAKVLGGIIAPDSGTVRLDGTPFSAASPISAKKKQVVVTSQELSLFNNLTVIENLNIFHTPKKGILSDSKKMRGRVMEILEYLHLENVIDTPVDALPPNQLYMLELAKALLQEPQVLVIDEITSSLFYEDVQVVKKVLKDLKQKRVAVIFISHRMSEIMDLSDKVTVMKNGEILDTFVTEEAVPEELLALMTGREDIGQAGLVRKKTGMQNEEVVLRLQEYPLAEFRSHVNLSVHKGEIIGIAGLQGHGQSTLIRKIYGLYGSEDKIEYQGREIVNKSPMAAVKRKIGFLSGDRVGEGIFGERSVSENLKCVTSLIFNMKRISDVEVLKQFNVKYKSTKQKITSLSGGNQQKVVMARWMSTDPCLLLADDPTKGIDVQARTDIHKIICDMAEKGTAVMMVSSDDEELVNLTKMAADSRIIIMYEGMIVKELTGDEITVQNIINYSMTGGGERK